jgi:hypothetical protein
MTKNVRVLEFRVEDPRVVVDQMDVLGEAHAGWVNLRPALDPEDESPPSTGIAALFGSPIHEVPVCTWVTGKLQRNGVEPDSLGIQHAAGTRAFAQLRSCNVTVPNGWRRVQDHPRRGLVLLAPAGTEHSEELSWLLEAGTLLSRVPTTGAWTCEVHSPG